MTTPQIILDEAGKPAYAVIPWQEYERLMPAAAEAALSDEALYDEAKAEGDEFFPADVVDRLLTGENPIRVYRTYRGMTQKQLAVAAGINPVYLSQIETGKRTGSPRTLTAIARVLDVDPGDLLCDPDRVPILRPSAPATLPLNREPPRPTLSAILSAY